MSIAIDDLELEEAREMERSQSPLLDPKNMDLIKHVKVALTVEIGTAELTVDQFFSLRSGDIVTLIEQVNEPAALRVDGKCVARGNLVAVGDNFGLQLTEIL